MSTGVSTETNPPCIIFDINLSANFGAYLITSIIDNGSMFRNIHATEIKPNKKGRLSYEQEELQI